jgi:NADP-dependent 3-hydroxy acid dehydrogenase YdfG
MSPEAVAIVTGGSRGVGREVAHRLADEGYAVVVVYLDGQPEAEAAVEDILAAQGTALAVRADVTDELDVERLFDETAAAFGGVDVVVDTTSPASPVVSRHAARRLRHGGSLVTAAALARSITRPLPETSAGDRGSRPGTPRARRINGGETLLPGKSTDGGQA